MDKDTFKHIELLKPDNTIVKHLLAERKYVLQHKNRPKFAFLSLKKTFKEAAEERRRRSSFATVGSCWRRFRYKMYILVTHSWFDNIIMMCILLNTAVLASYYYGMDHTFSKILDNANRVGTVNQ